MKNFAAVFLFFLITGCASFSADAQAQSLFRLKDEPRKLVDAEKYSVASIRESEIEFAMRNPPGKINLALFDGKNYEAVRTDSEIRAMDDQTWRGKIVQGKFSGDVILTFRRGFVSGLIYAPEAVYEIAVKGDRQILVELDQKLFPECGGEIKSEAENKIVGSENVTGIEDSGDRIDVLVFYTTATKNALGGDAQAQVLAQQGIDSSNTAYQNSKIRQRLRMVHARELVYTEVGTPSTDLSNFRNNTTVRDLREQYKADLVALIAEEPSVCGIGYLMGANSPASQNNGYTLTHRTCVAGNLSFAHELGHNMGSQHNPENGSNPTYPFAFGHYVNGVFRTVMSYSDPCTSGCARRAYFSNPEIYFSGYATGIDNQRDNARSINLTADSISNYRYSGASLTLNNYSGGETIPRNLSRTLNWTSDNLPGNVRIEVSRNESTNWETLIANTPNDGSETINITGKSTRRARLKIVSLDNPSVSDSSAGNIIIR